jgi:predicted Zn-dependent protease
MITRGSLKHMRDEAELAGVLAHEIAHVCHEDGLNAVKNAKTNDALATAASTAADHSDNFGLLDASSDLLFRNVFTKGYDRDQELKADRSAVHYMSLAGYDPSSYQRFIDRIASEQHGGQGGLFSTHPGFRERKDVVAKEIAQIGKGGTGATNADRFARETASIQ